MPNWKRVIVSGSDAALTSVIATAGFTGSLLGTASNALTASFALTSSFVNTLNQSVIISGSAAIGTSSLGPFENTLTLGARDNGGEGGQLGFNASGGTYTSASFIDNWQNKARLLKGTNTTSAGLIAQWDIHTTQMQLAGYTAASSFPGTATANLAVDSGGNVITVSTTGGTVFPYTGNAVITGSLTTTGIIYAQPNGGMYFQGGDDAALYDINVSNHMGIYGVQDSTIGSIKLGSGGGIISGKSGNIGIGTTNPTSASFQVNGNVWANSFTGSLQGTASWASNVVGGIGVTSVGTSGTVNGITLTGGTITTSGTITLGGTLSNVQSSQLATSSIMIGSTNIALGATASLLAGVTSITSTSFTGSLLGTASYATNALSASYAQTSSYATYAANGGVTKILAGANVNLSPVNGLGDVTVTSFGTNLYNTATGSYGSFYDTGSVLATSATAVYSMSLSTTDISNGVFVSSSNGDVTRVKFTNAGTYNLQFSSQFSNTDNSTQDIIIWVRKNGVDIPDSSGVAAAPPFKAGSNGQVIAAWNYYLSLSAGDYIQMCWHVEQANVITLETIPAGVGPTHPRTPSTILTATRVDTFLSNTGSFSGSFTGTLLGTASYATQALSASYAPGGAGTPTFPYTGSAIISGSLTVTGSVFVQDINGTINIDSSNRKLYDTNSSQSFAWQERRLYDIDGNRSVAWQNKQLGNAIGVVVSWDYTNLTQAVQFESYIRNNIDLSTVGENFANFPSYNTFLPQGEILKNGITFDAAVADFDLVYLETDNTWYPVNVATTGSRKMLGIAFGIANFDYQVLIEGTMVVNDGTYTDTPIVSNLDHGLPIYIKTGGGIYMSTTAPGSSGNNVRVLGHAYYNSTTAGEYWIMKFRPSNSWVTI